MKKEVVIKVVASVITITVLLVLIFSGPAQAYVLDLATSDNNVNIGENINFIASITAEPSESLDMNYIKLKLSGPIEVNCKFNSNGSIIEDCSGIDIVKDEGPGNGYVKILKFNITIHTDSYDPGTYKTYLGLVFENKTVEQEGKDITIGSIRLTKGCSIRAINGNLKVENTDLGNKNKISFYVPISNAKKGEGFLSGQNNRERFSYNFIVNEVLKNSETEMVLGVTGFYRFKRGRPVFESAKIYIDKENKKVNVIGKNVTASYLDINLRAGCLV